MIVKVCGMRDADNIRAVEQIGVDWMGFIFVPKSPRYVAQRPDYLPTAQKRVGVFVNADIEDITEKANVFHLDYIQLHGSESPEMCQALNKAGHHIVKVFAPSSPASFIATEAYAPYVDYFLFDTPCISHGGSGKQFDWSLLRHYHGKTPFLLSGGINPQSLEALRHFHHPQYMGIDVNSGFELSPALKNTVSLQSFVEQIKSFRP